VPKVTHNVYNSSHTASGTEEWLIDSGASVHLVNDVSILQNVTVFSDPRPLQLATEGAKGGIIASGSVCLLSQEGKPVWLHNVQCVPEASTNLLSVSAGIRDGRIFAVKDSGAYVKVEGPNDWTCRVQEVHGLYSLKGVYPTTVPLVCQKCFKTVSDEHLTPSLNHD